MQRPLKLKKSTYNQILGQYQQDSHSFYSSMFYNVLQIISIYCDQIFILQQGVQKFQK